MPGRIIQTAALIAVALTCVLGGLRWHGQRKPVETLELQSEAVAEPGPKAKIELRYAYQPETAAAEAFTVTSSDLRAASVTALRAEEGILTVFVDTGDTGKADIIVESGTQTASPVTLLVAEPEEEEPEPPRILAPEGMAYITPSGTRWHIDAECAGDTAELTAMADIGNRTPCSRCAQTDDSASEEAANARKNALPGQVFITKNGARWHTDEKCGGEYAYPVDRDEVGDRLPCQRCAPSETVAANTAAPAAAVYITPSGTRWHIDADCAGDTAVLVQPNEIGSRTPCKKCAQE